MKRLDVKKDGAFCYTICLEQGFEKLPEELRKLGKDRHRICIVTDSNVASLYLKEVEVQLKSEFKEIHSFVMPAGEPYKNLDTVRSLYEFLIQNHFDRKDCLIALGGGVVGDLTGFTAATYLRGIDFIQVPTTLLSQVDSSIGGKTGVDFDSYKNMVGAFHMPKLVYMNLSVLHTLSEEQFSCGMGEILKHGLIKNADYFSWCIENAKAIQKRELPVLNTMILESCRIKKDVVEQDPTEQGDRALLNFGHTLGHAVEKLKNFSLLHGQCVAIGCAAALEISKNRGYLTSEEVDQVEEAMKLFGLPTKTQHLSSEEILEVSKSDKKMEAGHIKFILLKNIGEAYVDRTVTREELQKAAEAILE